MPGISSSSGYLKEVIDRVVYHAIRQCAKRSLAVHDLFSTNHELLLVEIIDVGSLYTTALHLDVGVFSAPNSRIVPCYHTGNTIHAFAVIASCRSFIRRLALYASPFAIAPAPVDSPLVPRPFWRQTSSRTDDFTLNAPLACILRRGHTQQFGLCNVPSIASARQTTPRSVCVLRRCSLRFCCIVMVGSSTLASRRSAFVITRFEFPAVPLPRLRRLSGVMGRGCER